MKTLREFLNNATNYLVFGTMLEEQRKEEVEKILSAFSGTEAEKEFFNQIIRDSEWLELSKKEVQYFLEIRKKDHNKETDLNQLEHRIFRENGEKKVAVIKAVIKQ